MLYFFLKTQLLMIDSLISLYLLIAIEKLICRYSSIFYEDFFYSIHKQSVTLQLYWNPSGTTYSIVLDVQGRYLPKIEGKYFLGLFKLQKLRNIQGMSGENVDTSVANFIQKSFEILENKDYESIIHWMANGREFAIKQIDDFQDHILPKYFRHRNINSFIRQLNMYGFHKSRKDPSKNIFSHPFFLRGQPQILHMVRRKIKNDQKQEEQNKAPVPCSPPSKKNNQQLEPATELPSKKSLHSMTVLKETAPVKTEKETAPTKTEIAAPFSMLSIRSFGITMGYDISPFKNMIEKSCVMDSNPELYLKMRDHNSIGQVEMMMIDDDDDNLSIEDQIQKERRVFQNRRSGVSILPTYNLLEDLDFRHH